MKANTSKSKNAESFYIKQSYLDANGKSLTMKNENSMVLIFSCSLSITNWA